MRDDFVATLFLSAGSQAELGASKDHDGGAISNHGKWWRRGVGQIVMMDDIRNSIIIENWESWLIVDDG